jgi:F0F1-type ATP synthase delta subunit
MEKEIAAQLSVLEDLKSDPVLGILKILELAGKADVAAVIKYYLEIKSGVFKVAVVKSAIALSQAEKERISSYLKQQFTDALVTVFQIEPGLREGIQIKVGDDLILFV